MTCPKCGSSDVVHKDHLMKEKTHMCLHHGGHQLHGAMAGHPVGLVVVAGLWAASKVIHVLDKPWTCKNPKCGHQFS
jgi:RNA polymerase subunit RPABC4/transcription elongation factor Spt4